MKKSPINTSLLAIVLAFGLFLIAHYFDDRWQVKLHTPKQISMTPARDFEPGTALRTMDRTGICEKAERKILQTVEDSRHCATDDDCTLFDFGYPIQCMTSVARTEITALRLQYRNYETNCRFRVYYDCPTDGAERLAVCRNRRCTVELQTLDSLKDETLEYLGIGQ